MSSYSTKGLITVPKGAASGVTNPMSLECLTYAACASTPSGDALCCWSCHPDDGCKVPEAPHSRPSCPHVSLDWAFLSPGLKKGKKFPQHPKLTPTLPPAPRLPKRPYKGVGEGRTVVQAPPPSRLPQHPPTCRGGGKGARKK